MLVRTVALALLAANLGYAAWSQGWLAPMGLQPHSGREPERLQQQIQPEALRVSQTPLEEALAPAALAPAATPASSPAAPQVAQASPAGQCLLAGPFNVAQTETLRQSLQSAALPPGSWTLESIGTPTRWIVYMGKYTDPEALEKKRAELRAMRVDIAPITQPALAPGISLGVFTSSTGAHEHLAQLTRRGVRTARVVPEQPENAAAQLRLPNADAALRAQLQPLLLDKPLNPC